MAAFILFVLATAGVKGFAFTLGIGTLVSLFTAVLATQAILGTMGRSRLIARPAALGAGGKQRDAGASTSWARRKWFFSMSGVILLIGALAIGGKGLNFGIDFESGTRDHRPRSTSRPTRTQVRDALDAERLRRRRDPEASATRSSGNNVFQISTKHAAARPASTRSRTTLEQQVRRRRSDFDDDVDRADVRPDGRQQRGRSRSSPRCW